MKQPFIQSGQCSRDKNQNKIATAG